MARWFARAACALLLVAVPLAGAARASHRLFADTELPESPWRPVVVPFNDDGTSAATWTAKSSGGAPGAYAQVRIRLGAAQAAPASAFAIFTRSDAVYDPSVEGPIATIDFAETARTFDERGYRTGPALVQGGVAYVALLAESPLFTTSDSWTLLTASGLDAEDFVRPGTSLHPDFSATGAPISLGFYCARSGLAYQVATDGPVVGIDNWAVEVNAPPRVGITDEIRAVTSASATLPSGAADADADAEFRAPLHQADRVDATSSASSAPGGTAESRARASLAGGLGSESRALAAPANPGSVSTMVTAAKSSHTRKFRAESSGTSLTMNVLNFADGSLDLRSAQTGNTSAPQGPDLSAGVSLRVLLHRTSGTTTLSANTGTLTFGAPADSPRLDLTGSDAFRDGFTTRSPGAPYATLDYAEQISAVATLAPGEEFAVEYELATAATSSAAAPGWLASSAFYDTFRTDVETPTPGARLVELFEEPSGGATGLEFSGPRTLRVSSALALDRDVRWTIAIAGTAWFAECDDGASLAGPALRKGRSGRTWSLPADATAIAALATTLGAEVRAALGDGATITVGRGRRTPPARWSMNRPGTLATLKWTLPVTVTTGTTSRRTSWKVRLTATVSD